MGRIEIYTDGACSQNGTWDGGWGMVVVENDTVIYSCGDSEPKTTNNIMEMKAMISAIDYAIINSEHEYVIYTDSAYIVNCIDQKWYKKWQENGWVTSKKEPVANKLLWIDITSAITHHKHFKIEKVKGHNGNKYNELVDQLAVKHKNNKNGFLWNLKREKEE